MNSITVEITIILLLLLTNGLFALSEMAIISARKTRLQQRADDGDKGAKTALVLAQEPTRFLSTIQVGITTIGILSGAFGGATIAEQIALSLEQIAWLAPYREAIGVGVVVLLITYLSLIIGELAPKRIALNNPEQIAAKVAIPMSVLSKVAAPVVSLMSVSTDVVLRLLGVKPSSEPLVTEKEVKMMIYEGAQSGVFEDAEQEIVERVFRLGDRRVGSLMTHRTDMVFLDLEDPDSVNLDKVIASGHSVFPVCRGSADDTLGIIHVKDLFAQERRDQAVSLQAILQPPVFIPEAMSALDLLETLRAQKSHLALIIDEFGGISGMVTITDVLEAIVGGIPTLADKTQDPDIIRREDGSYLLNGTLSTEELKDLLSLDELPDEENAGYETLGGMIMAAMGRIPVAGNVVMWNKWRFEVMDMDGYRVDKVLASVAEKPAP